MGFAPDKRTGEFNGIFQANCKEDAMVESIAAADNANVDALLKIVTVDQLNSGKYQSMYIGIENAEFNADAVGTAFNGSKKAKSNGQEFTVYTNGYASFKDELVPAGKGTVKGIQSLFKGTPQVLCQRVSDFEGFKEEGGNPDIPDNPVRPAGTEFSLGNYDTPDRNEAWDGFNNQAVPVVFMYNHSGTQFLYQPDQIETMKDMEVISWPFIVSI